MIKEILDKEEQEKIFQLTEEILSEIRKRGTIAYSVSVN